MRSIIIIFLFLLSKNFFSQNKVLVNGEVPSFDCARIQSIDVMDTLKDQRVKIYHAEISNNCLELGIIYGDCNANIELVTDNKLVDGSSIKLYFLLKYTDPIACKATLKTKLFFDLTPFKNMRTGQQYFISFLGERIDLLYK